MQSSEKIIKCYNDTVTNYAAERIDEPSLVQVYQNKIWNAGARSLQVRLVF
jgi:hypothetical protein